MREYLVSKAVINEKVGLYVSLSVGTSVAKPRSVKSNEKN